MRLKVCGMREPIEEVAELNPGYMGFIFWSGSRRYFTGTLPKLPEGIKKVGVFVDASADEILHLLRLYDLDMLQLHGSESVSYIRNLSRRLQQEGVEGVGLIKAFRVGDEFDFDAIADYTPEVDYFLFDAGGSLPGGNGHRFDWRLLDAYPQPKPYFLSGGIAVEHLDHIRSLALGKSGAYLHAVDVNSGFESEPGIKKVEELRQFSEALASISTHLKNVSE